MIKVNGNIYNEATTYDLDKLFLDKARDSIKVVCSENILNEFQDDVEWQKGNTEEDLEDMSEYSKCVFKGQDTLLGSYVVVMSKPTNEEDLEAIIDMLIG